MEGADLKLGDVLSVQIPSQLRAPKEITDELESLSEAWRSDSPSTHKTYLTAPTSDSLTLTLTSLLPPDPSLILAVTLGDQVLYKGFLKPEVTVAVRDVQNRRQKTITRSPAKKAALAITLLSNETVSFYTLDNESRFNFLDPNSTPKKAGNPEKIFMHSLKIASTPTTLRSAGLPREPYVESSSPSTSDSTRLLTPFVTSHFRCVTCPEGAFEVVTYDTVEHGIVAAKENIFEHTGIPVPNIRLLVNDRELENNYRLSASFWNTVKSVSFAPNSFDSLDLTPIASATFHLCTEQTYETALEKAEYKACEEEEEEENDEEDGKVSDNDEPDSMLQGEPQDGVLDDRSHALSY